MARRETVTTRASSAAPTDVARRRLHGDRRRGVGPRRGRVQHQPVGRRAEAPPFSEPTARGTLRQCDVAETVRARVVLPCGARIASGRSRSSTSSSAPDGNRVDVIAVPASPFGFDKTSILQAADVQAFSQRFGAVYRIGFDGSVLDRVRLRTRIVPHHLRGRRKPSRQRSRDR